MRDLPPLEAVPEDVGIWRYIWTNCSQSFHHDFTFQKTGLLYRKDKQPGCCGDSECRHEFSARTVPGWQLWESWARSWQRRYLLQLHLGTLVQVDRTTLSAVTPVVKVPGRYDVMGDSSTECLSPNLFHPHDDQAIIGFLVIGSYVCRWGGACPTIGFNRREQ